MIDLEAKYFQCYLDNSHVAGNYECHGGVPPSQGRGKYSVQLFSLLFSLEPPVPAVFGEILELNIRTVNAIILLV